ncbi:putative ribonuclease H-like domain-containing protein [Tanacetum coccineum]
MDLPNGKRAIGTKWMYRNKKDERGIVIKNKARLVAQGYTQEKGIDYDKVFAPVVIIEAIRLFLAYASFKDFVMYQTDVKSAFLYGKIKEEVYVCQPPGFEDPALPTEYTKRKDRQDFIYQKETMHAQPWKPLSLLLKDADGEFVVNAGAGASLDRKSTTVGCQFLGCRLISWQCKKQIVVANSITEAEYIAASNCYRQSTICIVKNPIFHSKIKHIEIRHQFIRDSYEKKLIQMIKIYTDQNVADLLTKAFDVSRF